MKKGIILWLQEAIPNNCPQSCYFTLLLMDNNQTESVGTVAPELRMDLQSLPSRYILSFCRQLV